MREIIHIFAGNAPITFEETLTMYSKFQYKYKLYRQVQEEGSHYSKFADVIIHCSDDDQHITINHDQELKKAKQRRFLLQEEVYRVWGISSIKIDIQNRDYSFIWDKDIKSC